MRVYSGDGELIVHGTIEELGFVSTYLKKSRCGETRTYILSVEEDPHPYKAFLGRLVFECNESKIKSSVDGNVLKFEYSEEVAGVLASFFEFDKESVSGAHVHLDRHCGEDSFDVACAEVVVQVAKR